MSTIPFVRGSDTSEAAAALQAEGQAATDGERVRAFIRSTGASGATDREIEQGLRMRHETASARRNGLVKKGLVCDSGLRRDRRTVWIAGGGEALVGAENDRIRRPSPGEIEEALAIIRLLMLHAKRSAGPEATPALLAVGQWLRWIVRH